MEDKKALRKMVLTSLKKMDQAEKERKVQKIHERLFATDVWRKARTVAVTVSQGTEIDTHEIIRQGWLEKKTIAVPKCLPETKTLIFRAIDDFSQLESVYYGLLEPKLEETQPVGKKDMDLIIVPGLLFDRKGYRIGFGGGYYDRFLVDVRAVKLSQALDVQIASDIPHEVHDIPVDIIITPEAVHYCRGR